jgi:hypothetical protein
MPILALLLGTVLGFIFSKLNRAFLIPHLPHILTTSLWFLTPLSTQHIIKPPLLLGTRLLATVDQGWTETITRQGTQYITKSFTQSLQPSLTSLPTTLLLIRLATTLLLLSVFTL